MSLNFDKMGGILPAIIQDAQTNEVLMLGFMNQEAYEKTVSEGKVTFYSRTRERLWTKGEESGNFMDVVEILEDCDADTLLIRANPQGPVCHTGMRTCFGETDQDNLAFLQNLQALLQSRKEELPENSYTAKLFRQGPRKIAKKLGEEATELVIEAMDSDNECFLNEAADLLFHMTILLVDRGYRLEDVAKILADRHQSG
ncbi:MAG: bifunctional phosphoribosyl-AMP cyclohydrolase/phosphoribosyl-ATP diphosphatase HisIE [Bacteroidales bacterium]|nr:bifunctional phosphoribosyl-AMP cyclohydrolase/phosphoribosyl-ATP diphosphatase HisIE [Bacteroidales bacterium]